MCYNTQYGRRSQKYMGFGQWDDICQTIWFGYFGLYTILFTRHDTCAFDSHRNSFIYKLWRSKTKCKTNMEKLSSGGYLFYIYRGIRGGVLYIYSNACEGDPNNMANTIPIYF